MVRRIKDKRPQGVSPQQSSNIPNVVTKHSCIRGLKEQHISRKKSPEQSTATTAALGDGGPRDKEKGNEGDWRNKWLGEVPDGKDFEGGDVLRWEGIAVFPNASKLAKLVSELP